MCRSCCRLQCQKMEGGLCKSPFLWRKRETGHSQHETAFQVDSIVLPTVLKVRLGLGMPSPCLSFLATTRWRLPKAAQWAKLGRSILHSNPPPSSATFLNLWATGYALNQLQGLCESKERWLAMSGLHLTTGGAEWSKQMNFPASSALRWLSPALSFRF